MTARDLMHHGAQCIGQDQTVRAAAEMMRDLDIGALPICGTDDRLKGMITDRDIVLQTVAEGRDPDTMLVDEFTGSLIWVDAAASGISALEKMERNQVKRLPVIDVADGHRLVGIISEADLAGNLGDQQIAEFVERVYAGN
jgi:CBS domain-containing protein